MWIIVVILIFLFIRSEEGISANGLTEAQSMAAEKAAYAQLNAAASAAAPAAGFFNLPPVLRASGLSRMGDHASEISDPGVARDPSSTNGGTV